MKKIYIMFIAILYAFIISGCMANNTKLDSNAAFFVYGDVGYHSYSNQGVFFTEGNILKFADNKSERESILCTKAGCMHDTKECNAWYSYNTYVKFLDDKMLLVSGYEAEKYGDISLWSADITGENRKKLCYIGNTQLINTVVMDNNNIYVAYTNVLDESSEYAGNNHIGIYKIDCNNYVASEIWSKEAVGALFGDIDLFEGQVVFSYLYNELEWDRIKDNLPDVEEYNKHNRNELVIVDENCANSEILIENIDGLNFDICSNKVIVNNSDGLVSINITDRKINIIDSDKYNVIKTDSNNITFLSKYNEQYDYYEISKFDNDNAVISSLSNIKDMVFMFANKDKCLGMYFGSPSGNSFLAYIESDDIVEGDEKIVVYKNENGEQKFSYVAIDGFDFNYDTSDIVIEGDVDDVYEAWKIVEEELLNKGNNTSDIVGSVLCKLATEKDDKIYSFEFETERAKYVYTVNCKCVDWFIGRCFVSGMAEKIKEQK